MGKEDSRKVLALNFFEKYDNVDINCDFSGSLQDWFSPSAQFYFNNGTTLHSGAEIWEVMKSPALLGIYVKLVAKDRTAAVIIGGHEKGDRLIHQQNIILIPREENIKEVDIPVRRVIGFVSGPSEVKGQGTDRRQFYVGRTFWDTAVLTKELARREALLFLILSIQPRELNKFITESSWFYY